MCGYDGHLSKALHILRKIHYKQQMMILSPLHTNNPQLHTIDAITRLSFANTDVYDHASDCRLHE